MGDRCSSADRVGRTCLLRVEEDGDRGACNNSEKKSIDVSVCTWYVNTFPHVFIRLTALNHSLIYPESAEEHSDFQYDPCDLSKADWDASGSIQEHRFASIRNFLKVNSWKFCFLNDIQAFNSLDDFRVFCKSIRKYLVQTNIID